MNNSRFLEKIKKALKNLKSIKTFYKEIHHNNIGK